MPWRDRSGRFSPFKATVFLALFLPALWIAYGYLSGTIGALRLMESLRDIGNWGLRLLLISLAVTPLRKSLQWPQLIQVRRMIGVAAFAYIATHFLLYVIDQSFDIGKVASEILLRIYLTIGFVALLGLSALAATSTDAMLRRLGGRRWQRLHRIVYGIALLGIVHFFMQTKADVTEPTVMAGLFGWLMGYRLLVWLRSDGARPSPLAVAGLSIAAAVATGAGEALYFWLKTGVDPLRVLALDFSLQLGLRPVWWVLLIGLAVALAAVIRSIGAAGRRDARRRKLGVEAPSA